MQFALPEATQPPPWSKFVPPMGNLPTMIFSKQGVSCDVYFNFSLLNSR